MDLNTAFVVRLVIVIGIIWLTQYLLETFTIKEPGNKIILVVVILVSILFLVGGGALRIG